jgi:LytS/YehU family sensor histidine kinase
MNFQVRGDIRNQKIAPLLLLRFLENSFSQCSNPMLEQPWINVDLQIQNHVLYLKLMNGKASNIAAANEEDNMSQVQKRIELLYPARHELRIIEEPDIMIVNLRLELSAPHDAQMTWDADRSDSLMQPYLIQ